MLLDGQLYRGAHGFGAEIGHFTVERDGPMCACGERGHWEAIASGTALGRMARELVAQGGGAAILAAAGGDASAVTGVHVEAAARAGDADARALLVQYADNVALGLAGLANMLDPELHRDRGRPRRARAAAVRAVARGVRAPRRRRGLPARDPDRARAARRARRARSARRCSRAELLDVSVRVGLTLPSFVDDPEIPIAVARAAEAAGLDGVFVFDHLWRGDPPNRRPALECFALLGAVAAETSRIHVGTLVARATLRPAGHARQLLPHRAARERRSAHRGDRRRRLAEPGRERGVRARVRHDGRSRRSRCTTRCARAGAATIRCGSAVAPRRCARSSRSPTAGTVGAGRPTRFAADSRARSRGRSPRHDHVGRPRADRRRRRGRARQGRGADPCRRRARRAVRRGWPTSSASSSSGAPNG